MSAVPAIPTDKLGAQIARQIERGIVSARLSPGEYLGTEEELVSRHGVSRWILREAVAIAEMDGLVESRRGQGGGLYVSAPGSELRVSTLRHYFSLAGATAEDINELRAIMESQALLLAMRRLTLEDAERLRKFALRPEGNSPDKLSHNTNAVLRSILRLADQPALNLFCLALAQANIDRALWNGASAMAIQRLSEETWHWRTRQVEALIAYDADGVRASQHEIALAGIRLHALCTEPPRALDAAVQRATLLSHDYPVNDGGRIAKKPEAVARLIAQTIIDERLEEGAAFGSEAVLLKRFGVSRNVLRESIRLLERYGIVRVQLGKVGGLRAIRPDPTNVLRATSLYLAPDYAKDPDGFHRISRDLQLFAASIAARRVGHDRGILHEIEAFERDVEFEAERSVIDEVFGYYRFLAGISGNRALDCVMRCMVFQVEFAVDTMPDAHRRALRHHQRALCGALRAGDAPLARRLTLLLRDLGRQLQPRPKTVESLVDLG